MIPLRLRRLDCSNTIANMDGCRKTLHGLRRLVTLANGTIAHLLAWEMHERDGSWQAWISWVQRQCPRAVAVSGDPETPPHHPSSQHRGEV